MPNWIEATVIVTEELIDPISDLLRPFAEGESVVVEQLGDPNNLAPTAMLPEVRLKIYFAEVEEGEEEEEGGANTAVIQQITHLLAPYPCPPPEFTTLQETDWTTAWQEHYQPLRIGHRFLIQPHWLPLDPDQAQPDDIILWLDPGMAFGTGQHATTQLCLEALEMLVQPGMQVLDVGTGSGILAIAALKLGAHAPVVALDNDEITATAVAENATLNGLPDQIHMHIGSLKDLTLPRQQADILVANILAAILHPLIQDEALLDYVRPGGHYIFSGIIREQEETFCARLTHAGVTVTQILAQDDWLAIIAQAPPRP
jgi:ribosomal protein L11 methyltransferase